MAVRLERVVVRRLAPAALMPAGAFAVHQLRYWLAFQKLAGAELQRQGHAYLHSLAPWIVLAIALATGAFLHALGRAFGGKASLGRHALSFLALWLICAGLLLAIYVSQELLEGVFAVGHPGGLVGVFGYGGWWSIPASLGVGLVLAAAFHGARWALREIATRHTRPFAIRRASGSAVTRPLDVLLPRLAPLAGGWSGRGPPSR
jgi:hypothetical protein